MKTAFIGKTVFPYGIVDNYLTGVENGVIVCSAPADSDEGKAFLAGVNEKKITRVPADRLIAPGFVDIHCHAGDGVMTHEDPEHVMRFHRSNGTGAMLQTLYRNLGHEGILAGVEKISAAMKKDRGILGVHLEGPYLNPAFGSKADGKINTPIPEEYRAYMKNGTIRQWTYAPEVEGTGEFCREIVKAGIVAAIGHSSASYADVEKAVTRDGATIVTHIFDASGMTDGPMVYLGTKNLTFDEACMVQDGMWYEVINDRLGLHVRHEMLRLLVKTVGKDRIVAITDCFGGEQEGGGDVNMQNGEIAGSRMTMLDAARNFLALGYPITDVFNFTSHQPACAIRMDATVGSLERGRMANILSVTPDLAKVKWLAV